MSHDEAPPRDPGNTPEHEPMPEGEEQPPSGVRTMAIVRWVLVVVMALIALASLATAVGAFDDDAGGETSGEQYYCPMHPSVVQDYPGECPICSMSLVKRDGEAAPLAALAGDASPAAAAQTVPGLASVDISPERIQLIGMKTAPATRATLQPDIRTAGVVAPNERGLHEVQARFNGWIEELHVAETGQAVKKGQVLAAVYSPELLNAQQEFLNTLRWSGGAGAPDVPHRLQRDARTRLELLGVSGREIDELVRTGEPMRALPLRAPASGFVLEKHVVQGSAVQPGVALFRIADLDTVWVVAHVYESESARVQVGQKATVRVPSLPDAAIETTVDFIYPEMSADTRTLRVRMAIDNVKHRLRPGMWVDVTLALDPAEGVVVPTEAVADTGEVQYVFVALGEGRFEPRRVRLGVRTEEGVQVLDGVAAGDTVVTTAAFLIDSESRLRAAIGAMAATPAGAGEGPDCARDFAGEKAEQCRACEVQHRGMGTMEADCKNAIAKPWK